MTPERWTRTALAVVVIVLYVALSRSSLRWRWLSLFPILYAVLVVLSYTFIFLDVGTVTERHQFRGYVGIYDLLAWGIIAVYKIGIARSERHNTG